MPKRRTLFSTIVIGAALGFSFPLLADAATYAPIKRVGTATLAGAASGTTPVGRFVTFSELDLDTINRAIPRFSLSAARVPAAHIPTPSGNAIAPSKPGFAGFNGVSNYDTETAGSGIYAGTQIVLEPSDQALCVGNGYVLQSVNTALRVFDMGGNPLTPTVALNQFFGLKPWLDLANVFGDFTGDPKCHFDADTQRFFLTMLQHDLDPSTGEYTGRASVLIAVSQTANPAGTWSLYKVDTTNDGTHGTPSHPNCPCFGDQPLIATDANGFYISTNEAASSSAAFNGAQIYAMSKIALEAGLLPPVQLIDVGSIPAPDGGIWYTIQPATTPPGAAYASDTEYLMSALDFSGTLDNRIAVWALTNTGSLASPNPALALSYVIIESQVYGQPPDAQQKPGPRPLADLLPGLFPDLFRHPPKLELLAANDDRMNEVKYVDGRLWGAVNTVVKTKNGPTRVGIAYFIAAPSVSGGQVAATMAAQGYVSVNEQNVLFPAIGVNNAGKGAMTFTLVGPDFYPSAAYVLIDEVNGAGAVHIAGAGVGPEDGGTGYFEQRTARWGDYSAAAVDATGNIWLGAEYIPNAPRSLPANWGTFISRVTP